MSLDSTETETITLGRWNMVNSIDNCYGSGNDDGYLFFARELQKACAGVTIVDQVSTRIKYDAANLA